MLRARLRYVSDAARLVIAAAAATVAVAGTTGNSSYRGGYGRFINDDARNFAVESVENARGLI